MSEKENSAGARLEQTLLRILQNFGESGKVIEYGKRYVSIVSGNIKIKGYFSNPPTTGEIQFLDKKTGLELPDRQTVKYLKELQKHGFVNFRKGQTPSRLGGYEFDVLQSEEELNGMTTDSLEEPVEKKDKKIESAISKIRKKIGL